MNRNFELLNKNLLSIFLKFNFDFKIDIKFVIFHY